MPKNEKTPLINSSLGPTDINGTEYDSSTSSGKKSSLQQTTLNLAKICIGSGTLALPYASTQGGLLFSTIGLAVVATWNSYSVDRLLQCSQLMSMYTSQGSFRREHRRTLSSKRRHFQQNTEDVLDVDLCPPSTNTFGKLAFHAFGIWGLHFFDFILFTLFMGISISFLVLVIKLNEAADLSTGSYPIDLTIIASIVILLTSVPDLRSVYAFSALGLLAIIIAFIVIFDYGIKQYGLIGFTELDWTAHLWPKDISAVSNWFGTVVFSYGISPLVFNIQESMTEPNQMMTATNIALVSVSVVYVIIGNGVAILYMPGNSYGFTGEILDHLPQSLWVSTFVRLAMSLTTLATTPLIVIPCGDLIAGKLGFGASNLSQGWKIVIRSGIIVTGAILAAMVPNFVAVVSFVGGCIVSLFCFVLPPLFHIVLLIKTRNRKKEIEYDNSMKTIDEEHGDNDEILDTYICQNMIIAFDTIMLILGIFVTTVATSLIFSQNIIISPAD